MTVDRIYQLIGSAFKRVYGFYVKRPLQRFNVDNRAEKILEQQITIPKVAPRHENTDQLFNQIIQNNPQFRRELDEKRDDLLLRLNSVKVVSEDRVFTDEEVKDRDEMRQRVRNRLPQSREGTDIPLHAYVEPEYVPKGRISLIRALNFIGKNSKYPEEYDSATIAEQHQLDVKDVDNILEYFRPFYRDNISDPVEDTEKVLGIPKQQFDKILSFLKPKSQLNREHIDASGDHSSDESQTKAKIGKH